MAVPHVVQNWNDQGEPSPTPIWADTADAGAGPSLQRIEEDLNEVGVMAVATQTTANNAIPKPGSPTTDQVLQWNGSAWIAAKIDGDNVLDSSLGVTKLTPGTNGQILTVAGGVAAWQTLTLVPLRTVVMFHMDSGSEPIPAGWKVCNGQTVAAADHDLGGGDYTMPDFRNRFPLGADPTKAVGNAGNAADAASDAPGPKGLAGSQLHTITTGEMPAHTHSDGTLAVAAHNHGVTDPGHYHLDQGYYANSQPPAGTGGNTLGHNVGIANVQAVQSATTGISINNASPDVTGATGSTGSGTAWDHRPRFYGIVFIMKVKNV